MDTNRSFRPNGQVIFGIAAIAFGILFLLDNMDVIDARLYTRYWPVFLIVWGVIRLLDPRSGGGRFFGAALIIVGALLLFRTFGLTELGFHDIWPILLVLIGGSLIWGNRSRVQAMPGDSSPGDANSAVNGFAVLGGFQRANSSQDFRGGELSAIMGGCEVDLRQATIKGDDAVINTFAFWGGIKIKVPTTWSVNLQGVPFLGGFDDKSVQPIDVGAKKLIVRGTAIMGGVEITN